MAALSNDNLSTVEDDSPTQELQGYEIDQLDLKVIERLQQNGRIAYSDIARSINAPEATIRYRVKRLLDEGIISISAFINTGKVKHENVAYLELEVEPLFLEASLSQLRGMENISYIASVTGEFNIMLEYIYKDNHDLLSFLNVLKSNPEVRRLNSRTILKIHKAQYPARVQP
ncbi:MAG: winged helix-turn-helix transcriptional regulator [Cyanobacteria bacterium P01_D01_bin.71]